MDTYYRCLQNEYKIKTKQEKIFHSSVIKAEPKEEESRKPILVHPKTFKPQLPQEIIPKLVSKPERNPEEPRRTILLVPKPRKPQKLLNISDVTITLVPKGNNVKCEIPEVTKSETFSPVIQSLEFGEQFKSLETKAFGAQEEQEKHEKGEEAFFTVPHHMLVEKCWHYCLYCPKMLSSSYCLLQHYLEHLIVPLEPLPFKPVQCKHCNVCYFNKDMHKCMKKTRENNVNNFFTKENIVDNVKKTIKVCNICNKTFKSYKCWYKHNKRLHGDEKFVCKICKQVFECERFLKKHLMHIHQGDATCRIIGVNKYSQEDVLRYCYRTHMSNKKIICNYCKQQFQFKSNLQRHIQNKHLNNSSKILNTCNFCNQVFSTKNGLKRHMQNKNIHSKLSNLNICIKELKTCDYCKQQFHKKSDLRKHIKNIHTNNIHSKKQKSGIKTLYFCKICNKSFHYKAWNEHMLNVHSDAKFACKLCTQVFKCHQYLTRHTFYVHQGLPRLRPKRSNCDKCPKTFQNTELLQHHKKNCHSVEATCDICGAKLKSKSYLLSHMSRMHSNKGMMTCDYCKMQFHNKRNLQRHVKNRHTVSKIRKKRTYTRKAKSANVYQCNPSNEPKLDDVQNNENSNFNLEPSHTQVQFSCEVCGKEFICESTLRVHVANCYNSYQLLLEPSMMEMQTEPEYVDDIQVESTNVDVKLLNIRVLQPWEF